MITQRTLDILDSELRRDNEYYKTMIYEDRFKIYSHNIRIDPYWSTSKLEEIEKFDLNWEGPFKYSEHPNFEEIIENNSIGLYVMFVQPSNTIVGMPKFVLYVGISGEGGRGRPLKERLTDYFYINKLKKRENIHKFLQLYYEHVQIMYSLFDGDFADLKRLEMILHEFFNPKFAIRDFEPETKQSRKAWNI